METEFLRDDNCNLWLFNANNIKVRYKKDYKLKEIKTKLDYFSDVIRGRTSINTNL